ncbi:ImmA/IrrE family metallo-endopeptidase [Candidatus Curtissbacteria bacterium]|nr:ImmA/IrrE family metallo-endopeptidase [Candidatus Curtissbacteria bacterium]
MDDKGLGGAVKPAVLIWARESLGLNTQDVAKRLKTSIETINQWESAQKAPTFKQLEKLSNVYKRPLAAFFLPKPPKELPFPKDFRTLPPDKKKPVSLKTRLAIRRARRLQEVTAELAKNLDREINTKFDGIRLTDDPEDVAVQKREGLKITLETQFSWSDEMEALGGWISALEKTGIVVLQLSMPLEENRGFSLADNSIKVIVINNQDATRAKIFSLFHEYGHILLNTSSLCDLEDRYYQTSEIERIEIFCNRFAGALLVPRTTLMEHNIIKSQKYLSGWTDELLRKLTNDFKVSQEVILRRLVILGVASEDFYRKKRQEWLSKERKISWGKQNPPKKCIREHGIPFVSLTLEAQKTGRITYSDLADYLSIQLKHIPKLERLVGNEA